MKGKVLAQLLETLEKGDRVELIPQAKGRVKVVRVSRKVLGEITQEELKTPS